ncbi:hypothetical protein KAOT1_05177 [Kordia algicida OT-1]|uniref:Uncharacterized protein n=1 Tax=Kordia algicida OT-1 TaxID=391587 RepID=A9DZW2_9FLAO|nr:hypothetical protein KAOT1_05177 [Kordia algicida OT-1]
MTLYMVAIGQKTRGATVRLKEIAQTQNAILFGIVNCKK